MNEKNCIFNQKSSTDSRYCISAHHQVYCGFEIICPGRSADVIKFIADHSQEGDLIGANPFLFYPSTWELYRDGLAEHKITLKVRFFVTHADFVCEYPRDFILEGAADRLDGRRLDYFFIFLNQCLKRGSFPSFSPPRFSRAFGQCNLPKAAN